MIKFISNKKSIKNIMYICFNKKYNNRFETIYQILEQLSNNSETKNKKKKNHKK